MENAVEALKIAGSMLLFLIALSVAILSFTKARQTIDTVLSYSDRESFVIEDNDTYFYRQVENDWGTTDRSVGLDTIIPTLYRAYRERYKITFNFPNKDIYLCSFDHYDVNGKLDLSQRDETNTLVLHNGKVNIGNEEANRNFLNGLLYRDFSAYDDDITYRPYWTVRGAEGVFENQLRTYLDSVHMPNGLYSYLSNWLGGGHRIIEHLGIYYEEDVSNDTGAYIADRSNLNKTQRRVITYDLIN